ncbi:hypothetical protein BDV28DRAFT_162363 [Aspergillus coremiiformis]|uniref:Uncharacterized protein n=1 Tax=Aspergillus coremiiformis TaxID=138285 RepID=A0A5N6Z455_9EURO|nr:hypothetical protein BDV28DRAFT_162363 [Aspergillus coremiiformis]
MDVSTQVQRLPNEYRSEDAHRNNTRLSPSPSPSPSDRTLTARISHSPVPQTSSKKEANAASSKSLSSKVNDYWVLEIASCFGSTATLVGIIIFLNAYNGKPSPDWPYGITVNSILSWLVQIFTALLLEPIVACLSQARWNYLSGVGCQLSDIGLYDFASRGVWGCLSLIWHSKFRTSACLGALITILAIGTGPFVQQMVAIENRLALSAESATVPRSQGFVQFGDDIMPQDIAAAVYSSVLGSTTKMNSNLTQLSIAPDCPTGECEIPPFRSLAACSTCKDITNTISTMCMDNWCGTNSTFCRHSLPGGLKLNVTDLDGLPGRLVSDMTSRVGYFNASIIANFTALYVPTEATIRKAISQHCLVYWCVKTYTAGMHNNKPWEKLLDTWDDLAIPMAFGQNLTFHVPPKDNLTSSRVWVGFPYVKVWTRSRVNLQKDTSVCDVYKDIQMPGTVSSTDEFRQPMIRYGLPKFSAKLAEGFTTGVRLFNNTPANGTSWKMETQIHVRWEWIGLPALLVVLTALFLCTTMFQTRKGGFDVWKSSPTPLVCARLDQRAQEFVCSVENPTEMEQLASQIRVRFRKETSESGVGWQMETV